MALTPSFLLQTPAPSSTRAAKFRAYSPKISLPRPFQRHSHSTRASQIETFANRPAGPLPAFRDPRRSASQCIASHYICRATRSPLIHCGYTSVAEVSHIPGFYPVVHECCVMYDDRQKTQCILQSKRILYHHIVPTLCSITASKMGNKYQTYCR